MSQRDPAAEQLSEYKSSHQVPGLLTTSDGAPVGNKNAALTVGPRGPMLLEDFIYQDEMGHFDKERIPERVVHAKGTGAFGYFEVTHDITRYCKASLFEHIGKKTPLVVRFSQVGGERGSADTVRDPRGFAIKFFTEDGNWDLVGNNTPIFFIRDPMLFSSFIHTQKRNPVTNLKDKDMFWDFLSLRPESLHQVSILFSDRGIPDGYRYMHGFGSHTFKLVNAEGEPVYCKFHIRTNQGIRNIDPEKAMELAGSDPDYSVKDLYNAIAEGHYPSWTMYIQVMTYDQAENFRWNPFDLTKVWPKKEFPLLPVGVLTLNKNPSNYFIDVELAAFNPAHLVSGIEPSPDKMLQGRLFAYRDTQDYRIGVNALQLPINCPYRTKVKNYQRDGAMCPTRNQDGAPNYYPNSFGGPTDNSRYLEYGYRHLCGDVNRYNSGDEDNYSQVGFFWRRVLDDGARARLAKNIAAHLKGAQEFIQRRAVHNFSLADPEYGRMVQEALDSLSVEPS